MEYYLKDKEPEKNDYQKTGNFIEKEKFFKLNYEAMNIKYKSFDLSEQGKFGTHQNNQNSKIQNFLFEKYRFSKSDSPFANNKPQNLRINIKSSFSPNLPSRYKPAKSNR